MKKMLLAILTGCLFLTMAASWAAAPKPLRSVGVSLSDLSNPFFVQIGRGIKATVEKLGGTDAAVTLSSCDYDSNRQIAQIEGFIASKVDMIIVSAADRKQIAPSVRKAKAAGIVVVAIDTPAEGGVDATIIANNYMAGEQACSYIAERLKGTGNVILLNGPPIGTVRDRIAGCKDALSPHEGIKILSDDQNAEGSREGGLRVMSALLARHPRIDAVFATNDPTAIGADLAARQAKRSEFFITGVDGAPETEKMMRANDTLIAATPAQDPYQMAIKAVTVGFSTMQGKKRVNTITLIPTKLITRTNIDSYQGWSGP